MKIPRLLAPMLVAAVLAGCGDKSVIVVDNAKAEAERKAAAEHFGNSQYAKLEPLGAPKAEKPKKADDKPDPAKPGETEPK